QFLPLRVHVKEQSADFKRLGERYGALWTPTTLVLDPDGVERYRIEGFLPKDELLAQLELGLGHSAFQRQEWAEAVRRFRGVLESHPHGQAARGATVWGGGAARQATRR